MRVVNAFVAACIALALLWAGAWRKEEPWAGR